MRLREVGKIGLWILGGALSLVLLAIVGVLVFFPRMRPTSSEHIEATPERLARGKYLAEHQLWCIRCHSQHDNSRYGNPVVPGTEYGGGPCFDIDPGRICPPNITPDVKTGIGAWSDDEIMRAIREGVTRDGRALFPIMPYAIGFSHLSDEDLRSVVAYLRTVKPISHQEPPTRLTPVLRVLVRLLPTPITKPVQAPPTTDQVAYGKYLTRVSLCYYCHTNREAPLDENAPNTSPDTAEFAGGHEFDDPTNLGGKFKPVFTANITPDLKTGIGGWTRDVFVQRFKGMAAIESNLPPAVDGNRTAMPWLQFSGLQESDLSAIYAYLRTVAAVNHPVQTRP